MHRLDRAAKQLIEGEVLAGQFWPAEGGEPANCVLKWSPDDGCQVDVIEAPRGWMGQLGGPAFAVQGVTRDGDEISLLDAWVNQISNGDEISKLHASTVAVGGLTDLEERWRKAIYSTANLSEWVGENGLTHAGPTRKRPRLHRVDFDPPKGEEVALRRATVRLGVNAYTAAAYAPDWGIETWSDFVVVPKRRFTLDQAHHDYAQPLLAFTHFAADRPDALVREILVGDTPHRRIEVLRQGPSVQPLPWRPIPGHYLFKRSDLPSLSRGFRRWWTLHHETQPALGLFADHISDGNSYSPSRLLTLYTALEKYAKVRFGSKNEFRDLRKYGGVPSELTGCTNDALKLLGASRGFFAHAETKGDKFTPEEIEARALDSVRRASALMQTCLLREIGIHQQARTTLMTQHYRNWPVP